MPKFDFHKVAQNTISINPLSEDNVVLICCANQLTGFYLRATLALKGLTQHQFGKYQGEFNKNTTI